MRLFYANRFVYYFQLHNDIKIRSFSNINSIPGLGLEISSVSKSLSTVLNCLTAGCAALKPVLFHNNE